MKLELNAAALNRINTWSIRQNQSEHMKSQAFNIGYKRPNKSTLCCVFKCCRCLFAGQSNVLES